MRRLAWLKLTLLQNTGIYGCSIGFPGLNTVMGVLRHPGLGHPPWGKRHFKKIV